MSPSTTPARPADLGAASAPVAVRVRYFAAAAEAAGTDTDDVTLPAGATVADLRATLAAGRDVRMRRVLEISSLLLDGARADDPAAPLPSGAAVQVDVLPPFAGG